MQPTVGLLQYTIRCVGLDARHYWWVGGGRGKKILGPSSTWESL